MTENSKAVVLAVLSCRVIGEALVAGIVRDDDRVDDQLTTAVTQLNVLRMLRVYEFIVLPPEYSRRRNTSDGTEEDVCCVYKHSYISHQICTVDRWSHCAHKNTFQCENINLMDLYFELNIADSLTK